MSSTHPVPRQVLTLPIPVRTVTRFRSTWLSSSIHALRERGYFEPYVSVLPDELHTPILGAALHSWLPVELAMAHYRACDELALAPADIEAISATVTSRVHGGSLSLVVRLARSAGASPWLALQQLNRLWERVWEGGGCRVVQMGAREALVEIVGWPPAEFAYVQIGIPAVLQGILRLFATSASARYAGAGPSGVHSMCAYVDW